MSRCMKKIACWMDCIAEIIVFVVLLPYGVVYIAAYDLLNSPTPTIGCLFLVYLPALLAILVYAIYNVVYAICHMGGG